jgi:hypothetical protein
VGGEVDAEQGVVVGESAQLDPAAVLVVRTRGVCSCMRRSCRIRPAASTWAGLVIV